MIKRKLLEKIEQGGLENSPIFYTKMLVEFVNTPAFQDLDDDKEISINAFLNFLLTKQTHAFHNFPKTYPQNVTIQFSTINEDVAKAEYDAGADIELFAEFAKGEASHIFKKYFIYDAINIRTIKVPASALAFRPDGNLLVGTCYFHPDYLEPFGQIALYQYPSFKLIKVLSEQPSSALAILPDGNLLSSTCYYDNFRYKVCGSIMILDPLGNPIHTVINEPASSLVLLPENRLLTGTCYYDQYHASVFGKITIRNLLTGKILEDLEKKPASSLFKWSDNQIISGTSYFNTDHNEHTGSIVLRNERGIYQKQLLCKPADDLLLLPDNTLLIGNCYYNAFQCNQEQEGQIVHAKPELMKVKIPLNNGLLWLKQNVIDDIIKEAGYRCMTFHQGRYKDESPVNDATIESDQKPTETNETTTLLRECLVKRLPFEILELIYAYVYPFSELTTDKIINSENAFPFPTKEHTKKVYLADEFARKVTEHKFFHPKDKNIEPEKAQPSKAQPSKRCNVM